MNVKSLVTIILLVLLYLPCQGADKIIKVTTLTDFAPNCFPIPNSVRKAVEVMPPGGDSRQLQGYSWDVVRESYHAMGYTIKLFVAPWSRGMHYIDKGKVDVIFPASKTKERVKKYHYSSEIVDETKVVVYLPVDSGFKWNGLSSLHGRVIGTVRGWSYGKTWEAADLIVKDSTSTILQGFRMLDKDRVFGVVGYENSFDYVMKHS